jgi:hypothetical protein
MRHVFALMLPLLLVPATSQAQPEASPRAWEALIAQDPAMAAELSPLETELLQSLTVEQADAYVSGRGAHEITLATGETLEDFLLRKGLGSVELSWYSVDAGGGVTMTGGDFSLVGTVGQADAGALAGGAFSLTGGFLAAPPSEPCNGPDAIFCDGFESGDASRWSFSG